MWPNGKISQNVGPTSPPETPRTASPVFGRKSSPPPSGVSAPTPPPLPHSRHHHQHLRPMAPPPLSTGGVPVAFHGGRPDQLSPRTTSCSSSSSSDDESDDNDNDSHPAGPSRSVTPEQQQQASPHLPQIPHISARIGRSSITVGRVIAETDTNFVIEELSDFADSDNEREGVIRPDYIEYAESNRSRSRSRTRRPVMDKTFIFSLHNLNCDDDNDESDETDLDEADYREFLIKRREEKKKRRMTSGSIGKRTISESIGSDTDLEDLKPWLGPGQSDEGGTGGRRMRRRVSMVDHHHHMRRRSSVFQHEARTSRIEELDEPDSSEDECLVGGVGEKLARELPYYEYVSMEVDSP
ncbi:hypothetical protein B0T21DRAFT_54055 [Apiosordaria backusii]|uniref:Uncharacterized protein n=1 Tax=Apiosordaria backusii TaxID=314023 RepID=A0AA40AT49_9PEZI|nr:hypothetical protein B0T21DRAFT_54055 [Apiosordaria backusii]